MNFYSTLSRSPLNRSLLMFILGLFVFTEHINAQCNVQQNQPYGPSSCDAKIYCSNNSVVELFVSCAPSADTDGSGVSLSQQSIPVGNAVPSDPCYMAGFNVQWIKFATPQGVNSVKLDVDNSDYWSLYWTLDPNECNLASLNYLTCGDQAATNGFLTITNPSPSIGPNTVVYYFIGFYFANTSNRNANFKTKECESVLACTPSIACPAMTTIACNNQVGLSTWLNSATVDNCGQNLNVTTNYSPTLFNGCNGTGTASITFTLRNAAGAALASCSQTLSIIDNQAPTGVCPQGLSGLSSLNDVPAPNPAAVAANYTDNCGSVTASFVGATTTGNVCTGLIVTQNYIISDACGNTTACSITHQVSGSGGGLVGTCPSPVTNLQCWSDVPTGQAALPIVQQSFSSPSGQPVVVMYLGSTVINNFCTFTYQHIYQVLDPCTGGRTICTLTYSGADLTPPTGTCPSGLSGLACKSQVPAPNPHAVAANYSDNCSTPFAYLVNTINVGPECGSFSVTYVYHVYDNCFNFAVCQVTHTGDGGIQQLAQQPGYAQDGIQLKDGLNLKAYPNPAQDEVYIELEQPVDADALLTVFDVFGREMISRVWPAGELQQRLSLAAEGFPNGAYLMVVRIGEEVVTEKILLSRN
jgi:hypothetical protein